MLNQAAIAGLSHLIEAAPWARERLAPFVGKTARLSMPPLRLELAVTADGRLAETSTSEFDVEVALPAHAPLSLLQGREEVMRLAKVSGAADFAEVLGGVLRELRWEAEEDLSKVVGDIAAHRLVGSGRRVLDWQRHALRNASENVVEFLQQERPTLPTRRLAAEFADALDVLRDDLARLEKRVEKLGVRSGRGEA
jgi:ubiquinone biosynthesis protein UbiJ